MLQPALSIALWGAGACAGSDTETQVDTGGDTGLILTELEGSWTCVPGEGQALPGALYNHGGLGTAIGGDLEGTCRALGQAGYVGHSEKRRETTSLEGHLDDVFSGLETLHSQAAVDPDRLSILGFSRGGLLALQAAIKRPEAFEAIVLMAPAPGGDDELALDEAMAQVEAIQAPVLVLVAENDIHQADHVTLAQDLVAALEAAEKDVDFILYPPFGDDGHELFFTVGEYWPDVVAFLP